jgi:hypothetical protein
LLDELYFKAAVRTVIGIIAGDNFGKFFGVFLNERGIGDIKTEPPRVLGGNGFTFGRAGAGALFGIGSIGYQLRCHRVLLPFLISFCGMRLSFLGERRVEVVEGVWETGLPVSRDWMLLKVRLSRFSVAMLLCLR